MNQLPSWAKSYHRTTSCRRLLLLQVWYLLQVTGQNASSLFNELLCFAAHMEIVRFRLGEDAQIAALNVAWIDGATSIAERQSGIRLKPYQLASSYLASWCFGPIDEPNPQNLPSDFSVPTALVSTDPDADDAHESSAVLERIRNIAHSVHRGDTTVSDAMSGISLVMAYDMAAFLLAQRALVSQRSARSNTFSLEALDEWICWLQLTLDSASNFATVCTSFSDRWAKVFAQCANPVLLLFKPAADVWRELTDARPSGWERCCPQVIRSIMSTLGPENSESLATQCMRLCAPGFVPFSISSHTFDRTGGGSVSVTGDAALQQLRRVTLSVGFDPSQPLAFEPADGSSVYVVCLQNAVRDIIRRRFVESKSTIVVRHCVFLLCALILQFFAYQIAGGRSSNRSEVFLATCNNETHSQLLACS